MLTVEQAAQVLQICPRYVRQHARGLRHPILPRASAQRTMLFDEATVREFAGLLRRIVVLEAMGESQRAGEVVREWEEGILA